MTASNDPNGMHGGPAIKNLKTRYTWETYAERLQRAGVSWRIYHDEPEPGEPVGLNVILNFAPFQDAAPTSPLYEYAVKSRAVDAMLDDMRTGNLPQVSWIIPPYALCEHPDELPAAGENYVRQIVEALMSNPAKWAKTAFIIVYDENDGLFDHVLPPTPPLENTGRIHRRPTDWARVSRSRVGRLAFHTWRLRLRRHLRSHIDAPTARNALRRGGSEPLSLAPPNLRRHDECLRLRCADRYERSAVSANRGRPGRHRKAGPYAAASLRAIAASDAATRTRHPQTPRKARGRMNRMLAALGLVFLLGAAPQRPQSHLSIRRTGT